MVGFFSKFFGGKSKSGNSEVEIFVEEILKGIIEKG